MKVFQVGAAGGIGRRLAPLLVERGDEVTGMFRNPDQRETVASSGATPVEGDLISASVEDLAAQMAGHDAVVFSAGAHGTGLDKTTAIDGQGLEKAARAAELAGIDRFVLVSVFPDAGRGVEPNPRFEHYMRVKKTADVFLVGTGLDWVIVRPGTLRDEPGDGRVTAGAAIEYGDVRRDNVAAFIAAVLHRPEFGRAIVELTDGNVDVDEAISNLL
ncbi:MAG: NAD(P)H-binding protein [Actinomycetaceae bacterium]|nr:NAD(P)H-binding protein [Actinomycetaceae bacterium]